MSAALTKLVCVVFSVLWCCALVESTVLAEHRAQEDRRLVELYQAAETARVVQAAAFREMEIACLSKLLYTEARGELVGHQRLVGMIVIARRDDGDRRWPRTVCEVAYQLRQFTGMLENDPQTIPEVLAYARVQRVATEVYDDAWKTQLLPRGWECVRFYRMSDAKLARLNEKGRAQLRIKSGKGIRYFDSLVPVATYGSHTFYRDPARCAKELPTA